MNDQNEQRGRVGAEGPASPAAPTISLPRGGGAIQGIGEKFAANPMTGTASMTVPLALSPGRSGFGPKLSLSYDSGSGNGPFGIGWSLDLPAITRKTDKGLPTYSDAEESDVYVLSGAEDLAPVLESGGQRHEDAVSVPDVTIHRYRPRTEGLFARIERWTHRPSGEIHWRSISRDNVTTVYGKTAASRVSDPEDPLRMFSWRICEAFDDKGNASIYEYVAEDGANVDRAVTHERNRQRTANRYLKRILYGNRTSRLVEPDLTTTDWLFEVVFDYGEGHYEALALDPNLSVAEQHRFVRATSGAAGSWAIRPDPSSSYRAGFEVRTYRRCQRVLMFHRFPELGSDPHLVRSTAFEYDDLPALEGEVPVPAEVELAHPGSTRFASFLRAVSQSGYVRNEPRSEAAGATIYLKKSLPPVEFEYSRAQIDDRLHTIDRESLENLPIGLDGTAYQWVDLDGEGVSGILTEQADAWFYKSNLGNGQFAPARPVSPKPSLADLRGGRQRLLDLSGDGHLDVVTFADPAPGLYSRTSEEGWESFRAFRQLPNVAWDEPELRFIDLDGDGHADVLMSEDDVFTWYPSLAEKGFGPPRRVPLPTDEERGPRLVFADGAQTIYLADLGGDGLTDLVRIKNGEVCYWPNLGYGRFGAKVTMDNGPWFDSPDQFEHRRLRLADIDGSGTQDLLYLGRDGVRLYFNQSGNRWSGPHTLEQFPPVDSISSVRTADLLGNGTASLVWSSALPGDSPSPLRYIDLMGGTKPHLLTGVSNNLGAETRVEYAPSTKFYLADKKAGRPWITNVPFPVHVVERVVTYDHVSGNRFAARYTYHHGYFDGVEREFRGFGLVEQLDTEEFATLNDGQVPATNIDAASHVPPVLTRTWFHTGIYLGRDRVSNFFAGLPGGGGPHTYYREPGMTEDEAQAALLEDTILPTGLTVEEEREACRALRGSMLRQEVYALDGSSEEGHPYTVTEQNFGIRVIQRREGNRHGIFFTHPRETVHHHQERDPTDPRIHHALVLEVDDYGNVLQEMTVGYGRRAASTDPVLTAADRARQDRSLITWTQHHVTNAIDAGDQYRTPLPAETLTWELTGFAPEGGAERFSFDEWTRANFARLTTATEIPYEQTADHVTPERRLIEHVRTLYRRDDLTALLALRTLEPLALPGESYRLSLTPGLLARVFQRRRSGEPDENLLPDPAPLLEGRGADQGGYVAMDRNWWIPSGRLFFHPTANTANEALTAAAERDAAQQHFFVPRKVVDAFAQATLLDHEHDLFAVRTVDPLGNTVTAAYDHRVLQPQLVTDPNGNRTTAAFDALGMVVATATLGKVGESLGDLLEDFAADLTLAEIQDYVADPHGRATVLLGKASTCTVYDLHRFRRTRQPAFAASLVRETHFHDPLPAHGARTQIGFSYSDGFGREIQQKTMAEAGDAPERLAPVGLPGGDLRPGDVVRAAPCSTTRASRCVSTSLSSAPRTSTKVSRR